MELTRRRALQLGGAAAVALPLATLGVGPARAAGSVLQSGQVLPPNQPLPSPNGSCFLVLQDDGNLVVYGQRALWSTGTQGTSPGQLVMQGDGNLVLYDAAGRVRWASETYGGTGRAGAVLAVQDDGNVVVYNGPTALWSWRWGAVGFPPYHPNSLRYIGNATQVVVVAGESPSSTYASLYTWQWSSDAGTWGTRFATMPARTGYGGWKYAGQRVQGDGSSPAGTFSLTQAYGLAGNPGTSLPYVQVGPDSYRSGDPRDPQTYNITQSSVSPTRTWRDDSANCERFADYPTQYQYLVNIDFCTPPPWSLSYDSGHGEWVTSQPAPVGLGFAIYLHINGAGSTAGCVSLPADDLAAVMQWLSPDAAPRIAMAPVGTLPSI